MSPVTRSVDLAAEDWAGVVELAQLGLLHVERVAFAFGQARAEQKQKGKTGEAIDLYIDTTNVTLYPLEIEVMEKAMAERYNRLINVFARLEAAS